MKKNGKKYVMRESELKEIIQEMILLEELGTDDRMKYQHTSNYNPSQKLNAGDAVKTAGKFFLNLPNAILSSTKWGRGWQEKAAQNPGFGQWLLDVLGAQKEGTSGGDYVPNWWNPGHSGVNGKGQNADAHEPYNVQAACRYLTSRAEPKYRKELKYCARAAKKAMNAGGLSAPWGMYAPNAAAYLSVLPNNGWYPISPEQAGQPGDVIVIKPHYKHPDGHIATCVGGGRWVAEYWQNSVHGLNDTPPEGTMFFFRYRNRIGMDSPPQNQRKQGQGKQLAPTQNTNKGTAPSNDPNGIPTTGPKLTGTPPSR